MHLRGQTAEASRALQRLAGVSAASFSHMSAGSLAPSEVTPLQLQVKHGAWELLASESVLHASRSMESALSIGMPKVRKYVCTMQIEFEISPWQSKKRKHDEVQGKAVAARPESHHRVDGRALIEVGESLSHRHGFEVIFIVSVSALPYEPYLS